MTLWVHTEDVLEVAVEPPASRRRLGIALRALAAGRLPALNWRNGPWSWTALGAGWELCWEDHEDGRRVVRALRRRGQEPPPPASSEPVAMSPADVASAIDVLDDQQRAFVESRSPSRTLVGGPRSGKTIALLEAVRRAEEPVLLVTGPDAKEATQRFFEGSSVRVVSFFDILDHFGVALKSQANVWQAIAALASFVARQNDATLSSMTGGTYALFYELLCFYYGVGLSRQPAAYRSLRERTVGARTVDIVLETARRLEAADAVASCFAPVIAAGEVIERLDAWTSEPPSWLAGVGVLALEDLHQMEPITVMMMLQLGRLAGARHVMATMRPDSFLMVAMRDNYLGLLRGHCGEVAEFLLAGAPFIPRPMAELIERVSVAPARPSRTPEGIVPGWIVYIRLASRAELDALAETVGDVLFVADPMIYVAGCQPPIKHHSTEQLVDREFPLLLLWNAGQTLRTGREWRNQRLPLAPRVWESLGAGVSHAARTLLLVDWPADPMTEAAVVGACQGIPEFAVLTFDEFQVVNREIEAAGADEAAEGIFHLVERMLEVRMEVKDQKRRLRIVDAAGLDVSPERAARLARAVIALLGRGAETSNPLMWKWAWTLYAFGLLRSLGDGSDRDGKLLSAAEAMGRGGLSLDQRALENTAALYRARPESAAGLVVDLTTVPTVTECGIVVKDAVRWWRDRVTALDLAQVSTQALSSVWRALQRSVAFCGDAGEALDAVRRQYGARLERDRRWEEALELWRGSGDVPDAARCLEALKRWRDAAMAWEGAGRPGDALRCWREVPSPGDALRVAQMISDPSSSSLRWLTDLQAAAGPMTAAELKLAEGLLRRARR